MLEVARLAGIMAAKKTADLIPLCHPLPLTSVKLDFAFPRRGFAADRGHRQGFRAAPVLKWRPSLRLAWQP